jgi:hypothetical protein
MMPDFTVAQRAISGDSLRAVLDSVFAGSAYDWREQIDPVRWLWYGWNALRERTPAPEPRDAAWYARQADRYAGERRFAEAIQAAWHALVLELDTRGLVRYRSAKTPGEYAGERTLTPADRERLSGLVVDLYRFVFGREPCTEREYHAWRSLAAGDWHAAST